MSERARRGFWYWWSVVNVLAGVAFVALEVSPIMAAASGWVRVATGLIWSGVIAVHAAIVVRGRRAELQERSVP